MTEGPSDELLALDAALNRLDKHDSDLAKLVKLKYFAGLTIDEIANVLDVSPRKVDRLWAYARAWLHQEMQTS